MTLPATWLADVVLAGFAIDALALCLVFRRDPVDVAVARAPGLFLALAVRAALGDAPWYIIAAALAASGPAHLADLARRGLLTRAPQTIPRVRKPEMSASE